MNMARRERMQKVGVVDQLRRQLSITCGKAASIWLLTYSCTSVRRKQLSAKRREYNHVLKEKMRELQLMAKLR